MKQIKKTTYWIKMNYQFGEMVMIRKTKQTIDWIKMKKIQKENQNLPLRKKCRNVL